MIGDSKTFIDEADYLAWATAMVADGWQSGSVIDQELKTHPLINIPITAYADIPAANKA